MTPWLMVVLLVEYLVIAGCAGWERNWPVGLYFVSAACLTGSLWWMQARP
jgi:hypothetical protein